MNENIENISVHSDNVVNTVNVNDLNDTIDTSYSSLTESPPPDSLNMLSLNCCGIKKRLQYPEFENLVRNHDIICLVESKTDDRDEIKLPGYIFKLKNRKKIANVKSGGILLGFKDKYEKFIEPIETDSKFVY